MPSRPAVLVLLLARLGGAAATSSCTSAGAPASFQANTARHGGLHISDRVIQGDTVAAAAECAADCCRAQTGATLCKSWNLERITGGESVAAYNCSLRGLYSSPTVAKDTVSGVVYRTGIQPDPDIADIRGFNYVPTSAPSSLAMWRDYDPAVIQRDMTYAQRAGFNFARVFLSFTVYDHDPPAFIHRLGDLIATAWSHGVRTMPVIFDPCYDGCQNENITIESNGSCWYPSPRPQDMRSRQWWEGPGKAFVGALLAAFPPATPGLALWDAVNEPEHGNSGLPFAMAVASHIRNVSQHSRVTIGLASYLNLRAVAPAVNVLSFHSYHDSWELGLMISESALSVARETGLSVFNSETGCIARASAYDQTMELAARNGIGFAVWELMISDCTDCADTRRWKHGLLYADGTTRDPAAIAAVRGIYLGRGDAENSRVAVPRPGVERKPALLAESISKWLQNATDHGRGDFMLGCELLDGVASLLESAGLSTTTVALSQVARRLAAAGDTEASQQELAGILKAQVAPGAPLLGTKQGAEDAPATCVFAPPQV